MGFLKIVKFSTKALICGGAVYYTNEFGIWGNAKETEEGCARLKSTIQVSLMLLKRPEKNALPADRSLVHARSLFFSLER